MTTAADLKEDRPCVPISAQPLSQAEKMMAAELLLKHNEAVLVDQAGRRGPREAI